MGMRQGFIMSPSLFNIFLEHVMKGLTSLEISEWMMKCQLIRYVDDKTLVSAVFANLLIATSELETLVINGA